MKWLGVSLAGVLFALGWMVCFLRLDRYALAILPIFDLPRPLWRGAFLAMQETETKDGMRGILARISGDGMWLLRGMRAEFIKTNENTVYSYWQACDDYLEYGRAAEGKSREISRRVSANLDEWGKWVKAGSVVEVYLAGNQKNKKIKEVYGYDWRLYLPPPADLEQQCKK